MVRPKIESHSNEESDNSAVDIDEQGTSNFSSASNTPTKPTQKRSKPVGSILAQYCFLEKESVSILALQIYIQVEIDSTAFKDLEFCLYISSRFNGPSADLNTKSDLEKTILKMSGKVVQNPGTATDYVIADVATVRVC